jgi:hypothetical protein
MTRNTKYGGQTTVLTDSLFKISWQTKQHCNTKLIIQVFWDQIKGKDVMLYLTPRSKNYLDSNLSRKICQIKNMAWEVIFSTFIENKNTQKRREVTKGLDVGIVRNGGTKNVLI